MKKKITAIGIIGLFLLTSLTTVSAIDMKAIKFELLPETKSIVKNHEELPDLTMYVQITNHLFYWELSKFIIYNNGTAAIPTGTPIVSRATITVDGEVEDVFWASVILLCPFEPGMSFPVITPYIILRFLKIKYRGEELKIILDPPLSDDYRWPEYNPDPEYGIVLESNEDNNVYTHVFPKSFSFSRSTSQSINQYDNMNSVSYQYSVSPQCSQFLQVVKTR